MKTLITARFDKKYLDLLETITTDYEFAGYGVTGIKTVSYTHLTLPTTSRV